MIEIDGVKVILAICAIFFCVDMHHIRKDFDKFSNAIAIVNGVDNSQGENND